MISSLKFRNTMGIFALSCTIVSCTVGSPDITAVNDLPPIELDTPSQNISSKFFANYTLSLTGKVSKLAPNLQVSFDQGGTWRSLQNFSAVSIASGTSCTDKCTFSFSLANSGSQWSELAALNPNEQIQALIRGTGDFGNTAPASFTIKRLSGMFQVIAKLNWQDRGTGLAQTTGLSGLKVMGGRLRAAGTIGLSGTGSIVGVTQARGVNR